MLGIIGGSGVYELDGLEGANWQSVASSYGAPSDQLMFGKLKGTDMTFLPRHGRGHKLSPTEINYRANIDALKRVGVTEVISVSAVGSLKEHLEPGTFVSIDQFIDRTFARQKSLSTIDAETETGAQIVIEERSVGEVVRYGDIRWAPDGVLVRKPVFDVTPARFVSVLITENGVIRDPEECEIMGALNTRA